MDFLREDRYGSKQSVPSASPPRPHPLKRILKQLPNGHALQRPGVGVLVLQGNVASLVQVGLLHADVFQRHRRAVVLRQVVHRLRRTGTAEGARDALHGLWRCFGVVGQRVRQHDGVGFGMGQVEAAAQGVAQLVVQRHADVAEHGAAEPGAVERV